MADQDNASDDELNDDNELNDDDDDDEFTYGPNNECAHCGESSPGSYLCDDCSEDSFESSLK